MKLLKPLASCNPGCMLHPQGAYRWRIVVFLFFATTINYVDRQVLGLLAPHLHDVFGWSESEYGLVVVAFQVAYALGLLVSGNLLDRFGPRIGYAVAIFVWSVAGMLHAAAASLFVFAAFRFLLGLGESANFPAAVKVVSEWFPKRERALATGIFNSGSNVGAILTPLLVPWLLAVGDWQLAFIVTGGLGLVWLLFWIPFYKRPEAVPRLRASELAYIRQDGLESSARMPWRKVISHRQTLGISLSFFLTAPVWWFFLYWLPKFLHAEHGLEIAGLAAPLIVIYIISDLGAIAGGWFSSRLVRRGVDPVRARKRMIGILALPVLPVALVPYSGELAIVVALIALATFCHQAYASNIFTIIPDVFPRRAVGAVTGVAMFAGAIGGVIFSYVVGLILEHTGSYGPVFAIASVSYLISWLLLRRFVPDYRSVSLEDAETNS